MRTNQPSDSDLPPLPNPGDLEITDETYKKLHDLSIKSVDETIIGQVKAMAPVLFVHFRKFDNDALQIGDLEHAVVVVAGGFTEKKNETVFAIGQRFEQERMIPVAVFMGAEFWCSKTYKEGVRPSEDPDREDVILISGRSIGNECKSFTMIPISYDKDGIITRRGPNDGYPQVTGLEQPLLDQFFHGFFAKARKQNEREQPGRSDHRRR